MFDLSQKTKPVLKWAGGKSSLLPQLIVKFPPHFKRYVEPFLGSGACFFALKEEVPAILNDANGEIIQLYKVVRDYPRKLMTTLEGFRTQYSEKFYYEVRSSKMNSKIEQAARTLFLNKTGYNGLYRQNSRGEFNVPFGKRPKCPALYQEQNLLQASKRLKKAELLNLDFEAVLKLCKRGDLVYCDPPYAPVSQTSSFNNYFRTGFAFKEQERLMKAASSASAKGAVVHISNSNVPDICKLYKNFEIHSITARRAINSNGSRRGPIREVLISL